MRGCGGGGGGGHRPYTGPVEGCDLGSLGKNHYADHQSLLGLLERVSATQRPGAEAGQGVLCDLVEPTATLVFPSELYPRGWLVGLQPTALRTGSRGLKRTRGG